MNATRGSAAERLRPAVWILAFACSCLILVSSPCAAFEKWERPLGWNPQYGPRYVVFWGGPSGYKEPSLGTCSYGHFSTSPEPAAARLSAFDDFGLLSLYEGSQSASFPPSAAEDQQQQQQQLQLQQLRRLPFLESHPSFRYAAAPAAPLLQPRGSSLQQLLRAAKAVAMEVCLDFLQRMEQQSGAPTGAAANKLEAEAARVFLVLLEAYEAQQRAAAGPSPEAAAAVAEKLQSLLSSARNQESWDSSKYAYWLEASSSTAAAGGPYYLPDLEASLLASSLRALSLAGPEAQGPLGGPQGAPLGGPNAYRDCSHLASSSGAPGTAAARQLLCADSFFAAAAAAHKAAARIAAVCSPRGQQLISSAAKRLQKTLKANAKEIQSESPFKTLAEQILKEGE
ncbi:hypothetical protein, conserved [Eimeria necatrix]|uniref:Uncharacterized protein n=1 Tax=Eimeria necatrix TaxID=51315 RepID=U6MQP5_9EIME|nr:hypothetical protein, conserved [Eimeria necatrix]CDJ64794.1 hypothetical protein, conserved [Eimeria necatrix]